MNTVINTRSAQSFVGHAPRTLTGISPARQWIGFALWQVLMAVLLAIVLLTLGSPPTHAGSVTLSYSGSTVEDTVSTTGTDDVTAWGVAAGGNGKANGQSDGLGGETGGGIDSTTGNSDDAGEVPRFGGYGAGGSSYFDVGFRDGIEGPAKSGVQNGNGNVTIGAAVHEPRMLVLSLLGLAGSGAVGFWTKFRSD